jgi:hypothetical protein
VLIDEFHVLPHGAKQQGVLAQYVPLNGMAADAPFPGRIGVRPGPTNPLERLNIRSVRRLTVIATPSAIVPLIGTPGCTGARVFAVLR